MYFPILYNFRIFGTDLFFKKTFKDKKNGNFRTNGRLAIDLPLLPPLKI